MLFSWKDLGHFLFQKKTRLKVENLAPIKHYNIYEKERKNAKAARNAILKAGLANSPEAQMISKESHSLVRQHNKLRVELNKNQQTKARIAAENAFPKNPHNFASKLFDKVQKSAKPAFSA